MTRGMESGVARIGGSQADVELRALSARKPNALVVGPDEYSRRFQRARQIMTENDISALYVDSGSSLKYFTGIDWKPSERMVGVLLSPHFGLEYIAPAFEHDTFSELMQVDGRINTWHEDENPALLIRRILDGHGVKRPRFAIDDATSFARAELIRSSVEAKEILGGADVIWGCRSRKSPVEIALMQHANDITLSVQRAASRILRPGITPAEVVEFIDSAHVAAGAGGSTFCIVLFGQDTAFPHGVKSPKPLADGDMVLIDTGCTIEAYHADITRTYVFGAPSDRQRQVWTHEQEAQHAAFHALRLGEPCSHADDAMRRYLVANGYGPGYELPGVPHRTGHGIGLEIHEPPYLAGHDGTLLAEGMCVSIEPMICIPGEFGIRHEDHIHMTATGPQWFTNPALSIDDPFGNM